MEFFHGVVALVAGIVLILTGLVAWMYVQQSRMAQAINALAIAITAPPPSFAQHVPEPESEHEPEVSHEDELSAPPAAPAPPPTPAETSVPPQDDRVSVHEDLEHDGEEVELMGEDMATLGGKTAVQLRELLTAKGIPYSKSDKKSTLISLLQVAS
jgi:cytoskeletal protein RodZ